MIREQGDLLFQYILSHSSTLGAIHSHWMASLPQDQKFRGEKASHGPSFLGTYRLVRISSHQLYLRLTMCKALHENYVHNISYHTVRVVPSDRGENQGSKMAKQPAQGHRAHNWQTWVLNTKPILLPTLQHHFLFLELFLGKKKNEEPWWLV